MNDRITLEQEARELALERLRRYLREQNGEEPGDLAVRLLYDYIAEHLGPLFYNEGITAAQRILLRAADGLEADLDASKRVPPDVRRPPGERAPQPRPRELDDEEAERE